MDKGKERAEDSAYYPSILSASSPRICVIAKSGNSGKAETFAEKGGKQLSAGF